MKANYISKIALVSASYLILSSYSDGPAANNKDATGSPFANSSCSSNGCHGSTLSTATLTVELKDANNIAVAAYTAGQQYTIVATINGGTLTHYGFQMVVLNDVNSLSAVNLGTISANSPNGMVTGFQGKNYGEHNATSTSNVFIFNWTAPAAGSGTAKIYAVANTVNNNTTKTGDLPLAPIVVSFTEDLGGIGIGDNNKINSTLQLVNNRNGDLEILMNSNVEGNFDFVLFDMSGKIIETKQQQIKKGENKFTYQTENLSKGIYVIRVSNGSSFLASKFAR